MNRIPGMKSYTSDPSLRRHHFGEIEPMESEQTGVAIGLLAFFGVPLLAAVVYVLWRAA